MTLCHQNVHFLLSKFAPGLGLDLHSWAALFLSWYCCSILNFSTSRILPHSEFLLSQNLAYGYSFIDHCPPTTTSLISTVSIICLSLVWIQIPKKEVSLSQIITFCPSLATVEKRVPAIKMITYIPGAVAGTVPYKSVLWWAGSDLSVWKYVCEKDGSRT